MNTTGIMEMGNTNDMNLPVNRTPQKYGQTSSWFDTLTKEQMRAWDKEVNLLSPRYKQAGQNNYGSPLMKYRSEQPIQDLVYVLKAAFDAYNDYISSKKSFTKIKQDTYKREQWYLYCRDRARNVFFTELAAVDPSLSASGGTPSPGVSLVKLTKLLAQFLKETIYERDSLYTTFPVWANSIKKQIGDDKKGLVGAIFPETEAEFRKLAAAHFTTMSANPMFSGSVNTQYAQGGTRRHTRRRRGATRRS